MEVRIAWVDKKEKFMSSGCWHKIEKEQTLKEWVIHENKKFPNCMHWLEYKDENGNIMNAEDVPSIKNEWVNIMINNSDE